MKKDCWKENGGTNGWMKLGKERGKGRIGLMDERATREDGRMSAALLVEFRSEAQGKKDVRN